MLWTGRYKTIELYTLGECNPVLMPTRCYSAMSSIPQRKKLSDSAAHSEAVVPNALGEASAMLLLFRLFATYRGCAPKWDASSGDEFDLTV